METQLKTQIAFIAKDNKQKLFIRSIVRENKKYVPKYVEFNVNITIHKRLEQYVHNELRQYYSQDECKRFMFMLLFDEFLQDSYITLDFVSNWLGIEKKKIIEQYLGSNSVYKKLTQNDDNINGCSFEEITKDKYKELKGIFESQNLKSKSQQINAPQGALNNSNLEEYKSNELNEEEKFILDSFNNRDAIVKSILDESNKQFMFENDSTINHNSFKSIMISYRLFENLCCRSDKPEIVQQNMFIRDYQKILRRLTEKLADSSMGSFCLELRMNTQTIQNLIQESKQKGKKIDEMHAQMFGYDSSVKSNVNIQTSVQNNQHTFSIFDVKKNGYNFTTCKYRQDNSNALTYIKSNGYEVLNQKEITVSSGIFIQKKLEETKGIFETGQYITIKRHSHMKYKSFLVFFESFCLKTDFEIHNKIINDTNINTGIFSIKNTQELSLDVHFYRYEQEDGTDNIYFQFGDGDNIQDQDSYRNVQMKGYTQIQFIQMLNKNGFKTQQQNNGYIAWLPQQYDDFDLFLLKYYICFDVQYSQFIYKKHSIGQYKNKVYFLEVSLKKNQKQIKCKMILIPSYDNDIDINEDLLKQLFQTSINSGYQVLYANTMTYSKEYFMSENDKQNIIKTYSLKTYDQCYKHMYQIGNVNQENKNKYEQLCVRLNDFSTYKQ